MATIQHHSRILAILQASQHLRHEQERYQRALEQALDLGDEELAEIVRESWAVRLLRASRRAA